MEYRKLQSLGGGTLLVSLPKVWVVKSRLQHGDTVGLEETPSGALLVYPKDVASLEEKSYVSVKAAGEDPQAVVRDVTAAYLLGYNVINVAGDRTQVAKVKRYLRESVHGLMGLEVVSEDPMSLTLQFLFDLDTLPPEKLYRRMNNLARSMYVDALVAASANDPSLLEDVMQRDVEINRLFFLMVRLLRSTMADTRMAAKLGLTNVQCLDYRLASHHVELLGDHSFALATHLKPLMPIDRAKRHTFAETASKLAELHDMATSYFLGGKGTTYPSFLAKANDAEEYLEEMRKEAPLIQVADRLEDIRRLLVDIADLAEMLYPFVK
jgi:phosphate uptake regulator